MEIRPIQPEDLADLREIDATIESSQYLHLEQSGDGLNQSWKLENRPLREKLIASNPMDDEVSFVLKQIVTGADEGFTLLAEHGDRLVALLLAQPVHAMNVMKILDLRVDYDFRRQGIGLAMMYQAIAQARNSELRAVMAETLTNNHPANQFMLKCSFELAGIDSKRRSNHDLVKEAATMIWYASLD